MQSNGLDCHEGGHCTGDQKVRLEVCCGSLTSVKAAVKAKAHGVEICSDLASGGLTPSFGLVKASLGHIQKSGAQIETAILLRPRAGDFTYSDEEMETILADVEAMISCHVDRLVFGCLDTDNRLDKVRWRQFQKAVCGRCAITFHRAIDLSPCPLEDVMFAATNGASRILTSGQQLTAMHGQGLLTCMCEMLLSASLQHNCTIMPGAGVSASNAKMLSSLPGVQWIHASCSSTAATGACFPTEGKSISENHPPTQEGCIGHTIENGGHGFSRGQLAEGFATVSVGWGSSVHSDCAKIRSILDAMGGD